MTDQASQRRLGSVRFGRSKGLLTMAISTVVLVVLGFLLAPSSVSQGAILGMLPFASVLAIIGLGQMLVVQQGGIDLSVPGAVSLAVVLATHIPNENDGLLLPAVLAVYAWAIGAGLANGFMVGRLGLNPIIATLGTNALLFGAVLGISGGIPRTTTRLLSTIAGGRTVGIPNAVLFALGILALVMLLVKKTVAGRRFEAVGREPGRRAGHRLAVPHAPRRGVRLVAAAVRHRRHPARGHHEPADRLPGQLLPADLGRGRRPRRHVPARRARLPRRHRCRGPLPESARPVRARPGCAVRGAHPGAGRGAGHRRGDLHRRLGRRPAAVRLSTEEPRHPRSPENSPSPGAGSTKRNTVRRSCRPDYGGEHELPQNLRGRRRSGPRGAGARRMFERLRRRRRARGVGRHLGRGRTRLVRTR